MNPQTEIDILKLEKALAELDADWFRRQGGLKVGGRYRNSIPKVYDTDIQIGLWVFALIFVFCTYSMPYIGNGGFITGLLMLLIWGFEIFSTRKKTKFYEEQKALYESQKAELLAQIQKLKESV